MCDICQVGSAVHSHTLSTGHSIQQSWPTRENTMGFACVSCSLQQAQFLPELNLHSHQAKLCLQDAPAVLFCSEDRAVICRECDLMIHTANEFTAKHNRHILFQVAAGLKALPPPGPGRPDDNSQMASDTASAATHMDKVALYAAHIAMHQHIHSAARKAMRLLYAALTVTTAACLLVLSSVKDRKCSAACFWNPL